MTEYVKMELQKTDMKKLKLIIMDTITSILCALTMVTLMVSFTWDAILTSGLLVSKLMSLNNSPVSNAKELTTITIMMANKNIGSVQWKEPSVETPNLESPPAFWSMGKKKLWKPGLEMWMSKGKGRVECEKVVVNNIGKK